MGRPEENLGALYRLPAHHSTPGRHDLGRSESQSPLAVPRQLLLLEPDLSGNAAPLPRRGDRPVPGTCLARVTADDTMEHGRAPSRHGTGNRAIGGLGAGEPARA